MFVHEFHRHTATAVRVVPFAARSIPVLGCTAVVVFKALYNRTRDWADIEAMLEAGTVNGAEAQRWVERLLGSDTPEARRLARLCGAV